MNTSFTGRLLRRFALVGIGLGLVVAAVGAANAEEHGRRIPLLPQYEKECSGCHVAFPPGLLPAESWARVMGALDKHYGTNASLDAPVAREIGTWLAQQAAARNRVREAPPEDRITRSAWFTREHHEVPRDAWQRKAVGSAANCSACHGGAERGSFSEHEVRIPR